MFKECIPDPRNTEKTISKCTDWCTPLDYPVEGSKGTGIVRSYQNTHIKTHLMSEAYHSLLSPC